MNSVSRLKIALPALAAALFATGCATSKKQKELADQPVLPGQTLEFFGRGEKFNHYTPKAVNRESYAPEYAEEEFFDYADVYSK